MPTIIKDFVFTLKDLQFFADGDGAPAGSGDGSSGVAAGDAGNPVDAGTANQSQGETVAPSGDGTQSQEETFESLVGKGGKYHDAYGKAVKDAIAARFKNQRDYEKEYNGWSKRINPIVQMSAERYGIQPDENGAIDLQALTDAMSNDKSAYEKEAFERGIPVEDLMKMKQLERENAELRNQNQMSEEEVRRQREWDELQQQGKDLKQFYPEFNLDAEMQNPDFGRMLATLQGAGFPNALRTAYESVHRDEIMAGTMKYAVQRASTAAVNAVRSGSKRPAENGTRSASAGTSSSVDPSKFSLKDIEEYKRRAERGERITFR